MSRHISRREALTAFLRRPLHTGKVALGGLRPGFRPSGAPAPAPAPTATPAQEGDQVAVIQGRYCLAYQSCPCSICSDRCPVPGAIVVDQGMPRVEWSACTGCGICHEVCPAPENAILIVPYRRAG